MPVKTICRYMRVIREQKLEARLQVFISQNFSKEIAVLIFSERANDAVFGSRVQHLRLNT